MKLSRTLLTLLLASALPAAALAGMENAGNPPPSSGKMQAYDAATSTWGPADAQDKAAKADAALLSAALKLASANEFCHQAFSDLNRYRPLGVKKRNDLQHCLWVRYLSRQAGEGTKALDRTEWEHKTQLDARAADSQLVAAWQYPGTLSVRNEAVRPRN